MDLLMPQFVFSFLSMLTIFYFDRQVKHHRTKQIKSYYNFTMTSIYILLLSLMLMASANSEEILSKNVAHKIQNSETTMLETTEGSRFPELDPELVAILNDYTENENAIFLENRKKANAARAKAAATANTAKVLNYSLPEDRSPELDFDLEAKLRAQIWSDIKHHKKATGTRRLRGSN
jgi:hypothetical protein